MDKILIACDHAGFDLKTKIINKFSNKYNFQDLGCNNSKDSVDYPDFANLLAKNLENKNYFGILICGSGIGISIAANRYKYIRAALCHSNQTAKLAREHNNANVICLGSRIIDENEAFLAVETFINTKFEGGRHQLRVQKLEQNVSQN